MSMALTKRNAGLGLALVVTLGLVVWVNRQNQDIEGDVAQPVRRHAPALESASRQPLSEQAPAKSQMALDWTLLAGREQGGEERDSSADIFKSHSWYVPPPPKPAAPPPPPPKPVAPSAPFTYLGQIDDTPQGTLLLMSGGNKVYTVAVGETVDKIWRLDGVDANSVRFTYVPLGLPQVLSKKARSVPANHAAISQGEPQPN